MKIIPISLLALLATTTSQAEVAVVINPSNQNVATPEDISRIFLGKTRTFPNGAQALPVIVRSGASRDEFLQKFLDKNEGQLRATWSQLIFTGQGTPPKEVGSDDEVKKLVAANPNTIGIISGSAVDGSIKVIVKK